MKKLNYIFCKNFKAFYGNDADESTNKIVLDGKNLLLYGENGSGKSSLYWALYTFLQSALKNDDAEVTKYFDPNDDENLRNRYCQDTDGSAIELSFEGDDSNPERIIEISEKYSKSTDSTFLYDTLLNSDFLNYKFLFKLYDFGAKERIDLFPLFKKEMFPFMELKSGNADLLWKQLMASIDVLDRFVEDKNGEKSFEIVNENLLSLIQKESFSFSLDLLNKLNEITIKSNEYLKKMEYNNLVIMFDFQSAQCDKDEDDKNVARFYPPQVFLEVIDKSFATNKQQIAKPHIFLNEAKLSAVALSIRLALLDTRVADPDAGRLLVVDDLMISLDMSNRETLLNLLFNEYSNKYQIIFLTHDKSLYNFVDHKIRQEHQNDKWVRKEMFIGEDDATKYEIPVIIDGECDLFTKAQKYFQAKDYVASALFVRKSLEKKINELLPKELIKKPDGSFVELQTLWKKLITFYSHNGNAIDNDTVKLFEDSKLLVLNPSAHYQRLSNPIYRNELMQAFKLYNKISQLQKIEKELVIEAGKVFTFDYNDYYCEFTLLKDLIIIEGEHFVCVMPKCSNIKWKYQGVEYYNFDTRTADLSNPLIHSNPQFNKFIGGITKLPINVTKEIFIDFCKVEGHLLKDYFPRELISLALK